MRRHSSLIGMLLAVVITTAVFPAWAQEEGEARLGGGSDIAGDTTVRLPQGGSIPPNHVIFADNPEDEPIDVEFRADAKPGIIIEPEWERKTIPANGTVKNRFGIEIAPSVAPGEYRVVVQLVRADIEPEPGRVTAIPAIQTAFTVEVTGDAATVTVRSVSALTGKPVTGTITLSAGDGDRWFEIDRAEGTTLESRVAPGDYRAAVLLGEREIAFEEVTVEADREVEVVLEVETVSFVLAAVKPREENGRVVVAELVASVNNETEAIAGPAVLQARVFLGDNQVETATLNEFAELPAGISEAAVTYRPEDGWQPGTYRFLFELVTPEFTLTAADQPMIEVPAPARFDLLAFLAALENREAIALVAAAILVLALVAWLTRFVLAWRRRRRDAGEGPPPAAQPTQAGARRARRRRWWRKRARPSDTEESWLEERIGATTSQRSSWAEEEAHYYPDMPPPPPTDTPPSSPVEAPPQHQAEASPQHPAEAEQPGGALLATTPGRGGRAPSPPIPTSREGSIQAAGDGETANLVEALRVIQQLHDHGDLASDWSITDATLVYWAMISPDIRSALASVGMSEEEYVTAMKRLFTHGFLGRDKPRD